jgi:hypothetical protein
MPDRTTSSWATTQKVKRSEIPPTYEDLDPRWKGRINIEATDVEWMATLVRRGATGLDYFRKLAAMKPDSARAISSSPSWSPRARCPWA